MINLTFGASSLGHSLSTHVSNEKETYLELNKVSLYCVLFYVVCIVSS